MKRSLTLLLFTFFSLSSFAVNRVNTPNLLQDHPEISALTEEMPQMNIQNFLDLTPKKYKEITGERLGIKNTLKLKAAQKYVKKQLKAEEPMFTKGLFILLAILGLGWLAMGLMDDWDGNDWIISLVLYVLCWIPGLIYTLTKMKNYYP